jgi:hypothetical protein
MTAVAWLLLGNNAYTLPGPVKAELDKITDRGKLLAEYDEAAWQASDAVTEAHPVEGRVERYIARRAEAGWVVDFGRISATGDKFLVAYEAVQTGNTAQFKVRSFDPAHEDTGWNLAAAKAATAATTDFGRMDRPYNIAVLPAEHAGMYVYLYPAQIKADTYPLGGRCTLPDLAGRYQDHGEAPNAQNYH